MIINEKIKYLVGSSKINTEPFKPFDEKVINFLDSFSKELGLFKNLINYPDLNLCHFGVEKIIF